MKRILIIASVVSGYFAWLVAGLANAAAADAIAGPNEPVPASYFGIVAHRVLEKSPWPSLRFGAWRFWDNRVTWPYIQPARGKWDFNALDRMLEMTERYNLETLYTLSLTPTWASARPDERSGYRPGNMAEPRDLEDWRLFVRTMAERYKGRIRAWELWNEVNDKQRFYSGSLETMVEMTRIAYTELKAVDPANVVLSPSFTGPFKETLDVLDRYLAAGGGRYADALAYHFYLVEGRKPESLREYVGAVRAVLSKHGLAKLPIWNTESGLRNINEDGSLEEMTLNDKVWPKLSAQTAAAYTARSLLVGWVSGMRRFFWYSWDHTSYGLMEPSAKRLKPAGMAYSEMNRWMTGNIVRGCRVVSEIWACELAKPSGPRAWAVWDARDRGGEFKLDAAQGATQMVNLRGDVASIAPDAQTIPIDGSPVLLAQSGFLGAK